MDNSGDGSILDVVRILVLVQGGIAFVTALQSLAMAAFLGAPLGLLIPLGFFAAALTLVLAGKISGRSRRARKAVVILQVLWLFGAAVDLALSLVLAKRGFGLVPLLTRVALPYSIFRLLRRPLVRGEFGLGPTRRQSRKLAKAAKRHAAARSTAAGVLEPV